MTAEPTAELTPEAAAVEPTNEPPTITPTDGTDDEATAAGIPLEAILGGVAVLVVLVYVGLYLRGAANVDRYAGGFVIERCPVCQRGDLHVEKHQTRVLGVPHARHTVRCTVCRSVLREADPGRWRYAVDRGENPALYERYNGRIVDEDTLQALANQPLPIARTETGQTPTKPPTFVDDEDSE